MTMSAKERADTEVKLYTITQEIIGNRKGQIPTNLRDKLLAFDHLGSKEKNQRGGRGKIKSDALTKVLGTKVNASDHSKFRCKRQDFIPFDLHDGRLTKWAIQDGFKRPSVNKPIFLVTSEAGGLIKALAVLHEQVHKTEKLGGTKKSRTSVGTKDLKLDYFCGVPGVNYLPELKFGGTATRMLQQIMAGEVFDRKYKYLTLYNNSGNPGYYKKQGFETNSRPNTSTSNSPNKHMYRKFPSPLTAQSSSLQNTRKRTRSSNSPNPTSKSPKKAPTVRRTRTTAPLSPITTSRSREKRTRR